ncbi:MAG TPA: hypothetical protein DCL48_08985 [Alphaproteobacteria bacterium]|nr:hypothetical protein [Alphaproteobacteria bacterium]
MALITSYATLKTEVGAYYGNRSDIAAKAAGFIQLAEAEINAYLRVNPMQAVTTLTAASSVVTLPSGAVKAHTIRQTETNKPKINWTDIATIENYLSEISETGQPEWAAEVDGTIYLAPAPANGVTFRVTYLAGVPALSDSATTNWLLLKRPDIYLWGALEQASLYDHDDAAMQNYRGKFQLGLASLAKAEREDKWGVRLEMQPNGGVA